MRNGSKGALIGESTPEPFATVATGTTVTLDVPVAVGDRSPAVNEGLSYPVPTSWAFRGDAAVATRLLEPLARDITQPKVEYTPLWAGALPGGDVAIALVRRGDAAGDVAIETFFSGTGGAIETAGTQTLIDGTPAYAAALPDNRVVVLGPPGTAYLTVDNGKGRDLASISAPSGAAAITDGSVPETVTVTATDAARHPLFTGSVSTRDSGPRD